MVIVQGLVRLHPDDVETMRAAAGAMAAATRAEPGCIAYAFAQDLSDPAVIHIVEQWRGDDALRAHFATAHMAAFRAALTGVRVFERNVSAYDAANQRPPGA